MRRRAGHNEVIDASCCCEGLLCCLNTATAVQGTSPFGTHAMTHDGLPFDTWGSVGSVPHTCPLVDAPKELDWSLDAYCDAHGTPQIVFTVSGHWTTFTWFSDILFDPPTPPNATFISQSGDGQTTTWRLDALDCTGLFPPAIIDCACINTTVPAIASSFDVTVQCLPA